MAEIRLKDNESLESAFGEVSGGKLTHLTGNLYLLQAKKPTVTIEKLED